MLRPEILSGAELFRAMIALEPEGLPDLSNKNIVLLEGLHDPIVSKHEAEWLFDIFEKSGSNLTSNG